jgi:hypothetical protein
MSVSVFDYKSYSIDIYLPNEGSIFTGYFNVNIETDVIQDFYYKNNNDEYESILLEPGDNGSDNIFINNNFTYGGALISSVIPYINTTYYDPSKLNLWVDDDGTMVISYYTDYWTSNYDFEFVFTFIPYLKGIVAFNGYLYTTQGGNISQTNISSQIKTTFYDDNIEYISLVTFNGYLYAANSNSIIQIDLSNPNNVVSPWPSQGLINAISLNGSGWVATDGNYLYITNNNSISRISLTVPNLDYTANWVSVNNPTGMTIYNGYLYACTSDNKIYRISLTSKSIFTWATNFQGLNNPQGIVNDGTYLYVANYNVNRICQISITNPNINYNISWATNSQGLNGPFGLTTYNDYLYATNSNINININIITQLDLPTPPVPPTPPAPPAPTPPYVIDDAMESCLIDTQLKSCNTSCKPSYKKFVTSGNDPSISKAMLISMRIKTAKRNNCNVVNYIKNDSSCY